MLVYYKNKKLNHSADFSLFQKLISPSPILNPGLAILQQEKTEIVFAVALLAGLTLIFVLFFPARIEFFQLIAIK